MTVYLPVCQSFVALYSFAAHCRRSFLFQAGCEDGSVKLFNVQNNSILYERSFDKQEGKSSSHGSVK